MSKILTTLLVGGAAAALAAVPAEARRDSPDVQLQKLLDGRVAGKPVDCISLSNSQSSTIIDGRAIVYRAGSRLYVNVPRSGAESLDDDDILVTRTFTNRLCSRDTVNLVSRAGRIPHGFVLLGEFVPYERPKGRR
jgi:hypothetical protein